MAVKEDVIAPFFLPFFVHILSGIFIALFELFFEASRAIVRTGLKFPSALKAKKSQSCARQ
ncbi:hypothetical protein DRO91_03345 [Candidatus Heimdallarchaeota archaeon]|nr:MAG: hypothetical protein DRP02_03185 [Candidatus Gerdarchaeota archaeon]RLI73244.1 MAG: hypothetical protein DRO91_03345 [Candidatus Heimdallarchaeota archaeon]